MKFRKFLCFVLIFAIMMSLGVTAFADALISDAYLSGRRSLKINADNTVNIADSSIIEGHLINEDYTVSEVTTDDVEQIVYERGFALLRGDKDKVAELEQELDDIGVRDSTPSEVQSLAGTSVQSVNAASSYVTYKTVTSSVSVGGKTYQVKEVIVLPTENCNLFHSVSINKTTTSSKVASGAYNLLKVLGTTAASPVTSKYKTCVKAFNAFKAVIPSLSSTTNVYGITASYVCAALEQVRFYSYKSESGYWNNYGSSSYVQTGFSSTVFNIDYSGGSKQGLNMSVSSAEDTICAPYSYKAADILARYFETYMSDKKSQVINVIFHHDANGTRKTIKILGMVCPTTTDYIGRNSISSNPQI